MEYFQSGIEFSTGMANKALMGAISSAMSGESFARNRYTNTTQGDLYVGLTPNQPLGTIIPITPAEYEGGLLNCKLGAYMASTGSDMRVDVKYQPGKSCAACCACCCDGGPPPIVQQVQGNGQAFLTAMGTIAERRLEPGETIKIDTDALVAFEDSIEYDAVNAGSFALCCCAGEGCYMTTLTGKSGGPGGKIWVQSFNMEKLTRLLVTVNEESEGGDGGGDGGGAPASAEDMER